MDVANMLDCDIVISEFKLQSRYYIHFRSNTLGKGMNRFSAFWLGHLTFVPDGRSKSRADSGPNRPPVSAGQPSGGQAAFQTPCIALDLTV